MKTTAYTLFFCLTLLLPVRSPGQFLSSVPHEQPDTTGYLATIADRSLRFDTVFYNEPTVAIPVPDESEAWRSWSLAQNFDFGRDRGSLPMIADLQALHPYFRDKVIRLIHLCKAKGIELRIVESFRTRAKQAEYYSMGKKYTRSAGGRSKHQYGLAVDLVPIVNGEAEWDNKPLWRKIGLVGESLGLRWGGRWRSIYDPAHFEWTGSLKLQDLAEGADPPIPHPTRYPCLQEDLAILKRYWDAWEGEQSGIVRGF